MQGYRAGEQGAGIQGKGTGQGYKVGGKGQGNRADFQGRGAGQRFGTRRGTNRAQWAGNDGWIQKQ